MKHGINIYQADDIYQQESENLTLIEDRWYASRPLGTGGFLRRVKCAFLVFTGRADVLVWHKQ